MEEDIIIEEQQPVGVYIRVDKKNEVVEVNSSMFISDLTDWIKIDEGNGYKYSHAQSNYFDKSIITEYGDYTYEYVDGKIREIDQINNIQRHEKEMRIAELKQLLANSDYKFRKYMEGWLTEEEYAPIKAQCQAWRDEINGIESLL